MGKIEILVYILFAIAVFFIFGLTIPAIVVMVIAFSIIQWKIKKNDPVKAKKLNMIGIIILAIIAISYFLLGAIVSNFLYSLTPKLTENIQQVNFPDADTIDISSGICVPNDSYKISVVYGSRIPLPTKSIKLLIDNIPVNSVTWNYDSVRKGIGATGIITNPKGGDIGSLHKITVIGPANNVSLRVHC